MIGSTFYVMELVEGRIFWNPTLPDLTPQERAAHFDTLNATIAALHAINPADIGLEDYGRPGNFFARQIERWSKQYLADDLAGRDPNMDRLIEWLPANMPADDGASSIIHGDYRADNLIFAPDGPDVRAVLDWELSTLGHPMGDFTYHMMMYRLPPHMIGGFAGADLESLGIPSEADYLAAYCERTGRPARKIFASTSPSTCSVSPPSSTASRAACCVAAPPPNTPRPWPTTSPNSPPSPGRKPEPPHEQHLDDRRP